MARSKYIYLFTVNGQYALQTASFDPTVVARLKADISEAYRRWDLRYHCWVISPAGLPDLETALSFLEDVHDYYVRLKPHRKLKGHAWCSVSYCNSKRWYQDRSLITAHGHATAEEAEEALSGLSCTARCSGRHAVEKRAVYSPELKQAKNPYTGRWDDYQTSIPRGAVDTSLVPVYGSFVDQLDDAGVRVFAELLDLWVEEAVGV